MLVKQLPKKRAPLPSDYLRDKMRKDDTSTTTANIAVADLTEADAHRELDRLPVLFIIITRNITTMMRLRFLMLSLMP